MQLKQCGLNFNQLLAIELQNGLDPLVEEQIQDLLCWKKQTLETEDVPKNPIFNAWIKSELENNPDDLNLADFKTDLDELDILFRRMIK